MDWCLRTQLLLGEDGVERLQRARVAVFGIGGVGSYVAEALARAGVGGLTLVDGDVVSETNLNRQIVALHSTLGRNKARVMMERILDINPDAQVRAVEEFYTKENCGVIDFSQFDYVADAIDMVPSKVLLAIKCREAGTRLIASMGAGNRLDPSSFQVLDIFKTEGDPLARVMRRELRLHGIERLDVVFSKELPRKRREGERTVGSVSFVPSAAGLVMAGKIVRDIAEGKDA